MKTFIVSRKTLLFAFGSMLLLGACSPDNELLPQKPVSSVDSPVPAKPEVPGSSTVVSGTSVVGISLKTVRLAWGGLDFQEWTHDAAGQLVRYVSQYNSVQGTDQVRRTAYEFQYKADKQVERLDISYNTGGKSYVIYRYTNGRLAGADEYASAGNKLASYEYQFSDENRLQAQEEIRYDSYGEAKYFIRKEFAYDKRGNLSEVVRYYSDANQRKWQFQLRTVYSQFDNLTHTVEDMLLTNPYLPGVRFWVNNPGRKQNFGSDGQLLPGEEFYTYSANADGKPAAKSVSGTGGRLTGSFSYSPNW